MYLIHPYNNTQKVFDRQLVGVQLGFIEQKRFVSITISEIISSPDYNK